MVTIVDFKTRKNANGGEFNVLIISGGIEPVKSESGQIYFTSRKTSVACNFTDEMCKDLIGTKFPGSIEKVPCEPYSYTIPTTNQTVTLDYKWDYVDSVEETMQQQLVSDEVVY